MAAPLPTVSETPRTERSSARGSMPAAPAVERRHVASRQQMILNVTKQYVEMPTLCLTVPQAARLFGMPCEMALRILNELASHGVLRRTSAGAWVRRDRLF
ncbi:MAG: hypothetical protein AB7I50_04025 [Vicinamibacterales bacterium]